MKADRLADLVLLRLGENPELCMHDTGAAGCTLRQLILAFVDECAAQAVAETPTEQLSGWLPLAGATLTVDSSGRGLLSLPEDTLLLHSLRLESWQRPVTEFLPHSHWLRRLQRSRWHGLRGSAQKPLAFHAVDAYGHHALELFSCLPDDTVAEGHYMPKPHTDASGEISIPGAALERCVSLLVERIRASNSSA